jgi:tetratricopeptide (TPR) repeat protein
MRLTCQSNLALLFKTLGQYEEAISIFESLHDAFLQAFGPLHTSTVTLKHNLAASYKAHKAPDKAIKLLDPLPKLAPQTIQSYVLKATCYRDVNQFELAKITIEDAEKYIENTYGKGNVISVNLLNAKGLILKAMKEYEEAEKCFKE